MPDSHDYVCPDETCGFLSAQWPTKAAADRRGKQHQTEHDTGDPMPELADVDRRTAKPVNQ